MASEPQEDTVSLGGEDPSTLDPRHADSHESSPDPHETSKNGSTASDNETGERPVRRKLKETRITSESNPATADDSGNSSDASSPRGRLKKKRSHEDLQADDEIDASEEKTESGHRRKRSRDGQEEGTAGRSARDVTPERRHNEDEATKQILSPKKKRSLDQLEKDDLKTENASSAEGESQTAPTEVDKLRSEGEREKKRHRDASQERKESGGDPSAKVSNLPQSGTAENLTCYASVLPA